MRQGPVGPTGEHSLRNCTLTGKDVHCIMLYLDEHRLQLAQCFLEQEKGSEVGVLAGWGFVHGGPA